MEFWSGTRDIYIDFKNVYHYISVTDLWVSDARNYVQLLENGVYLYQY